LSPFDPLLYAAHLALGIAALQEERYEETATWWEKCAEANPIFGMIVIAQA
jgi:adenylate cyclase